MWVCAVSVGIRQWEAPAGSRRRMHSQCNLHAQSPGNGRGGCVATGPRWNDLARALVVHALVCWGWQCFVPPGWGLLYG
jgi:hypothetical protein